MRILLLLLIVVAVPAHAQKIRLDCEHDGGVRRSDGLPSDMKFNFFRLEIDLETNQVAFPEGPEEIKAIQVSIQDHLIIFLLDLPGTNLSRRIWISRNTGRLYAIQFGIDDDNKVVDIIATGVCQKPSPIF